MNKFFDANKVPSRPGEYIHKRDEIEKETPIFKYRQPSNPTEQPKKIEELKGDKPKNTRSPIS